MVSENLYKYKYLKYKNKYLYLKNSMKGGAAASSAVMLSDIKPQVELHDKIMLAKDMSKEFNYSFDEARIFYQKNKAEFVKVFSDKF